MNFLLDENFPKSSVAFLQDQGHTVFDYRGTSEEGADDARVFQLAQKHQAVILTTDRDFYHTVPVQHLHHCGVVVIALRQPNRKAILEKLNWLLKKSAILPLTDKVIQLRDTSFRIRHPN